MIRYVTEGLGPPFSHLHQGPRRLTMNFITVNGVVFPVKGGRLAAAEIYRAAGGEKKK